MIKAVVFDMDDTLYPERDYLVSGFDKIASYLVSIYNINNASQRLLELFDINKEDVYLRYLEEIGRGEDRELLSRMIEIYRSNKPIKLNFYQDVLPLFEYLNSNKIKIGVITDGRLEGQLNKIRALGLSKFADYILPTESIDGEKFRKPHPMPFEMMARKLNVDFEQMLFVGDNPIKDFAIRELYPIKTIEIERKNKIHDCNSYLKGILPSFKINSLLEIVQIINTTN